MQMPEGYYCLKSRIENVADARDLHIALNLMKEMAEALGRVIRQADHSNLISEGTKQQLNRVYEKFKEWK